MARIIRPPGDETYRGITIHVQEGTRPTQDSTQPSDEWIYQGNGIDKGLFVFTDYAPMGFSFRTRDTFPSREEALAAGRALAYQFVEDPVRTLRICDLHEVRHQIKCLENSLALQRRMELELKAQLGL